MQRHKPIKHITKIPLYEDISHIYLLLSFFYMQMDFNSQHCIVTHLIFHFTILHLVLMFFNSLNQNNVEFSRKEDIKIAVKIFHRLKLILF